MLNEYQPLEENHRPSRRLLTIGKSLREIIEIGKAEEETAISLYNEIIVKAREDGDDITETLFKQILRDEEKHHRTFLDQLKGIK